MDQLITLIINSAGTILAAITVALVKYWVETHRSTKTQRQPARPTGSRPASKDKPKDPFLKYYVVAAVTLTICLWLTMKYTAGETQRDAVRLLFVLTALFATVAVFWRFLDIHFYCSNPKLYPLPVGYEHEPKYLPYFILLGATAIVLIATIFHYTSAEENRIPIFLSFVYLSTYLAICRFGWALVELRVYKLDLIRKSA